MMESSGVNAVDRAFSIIDSFENGETTLSLQTLAARTGLNKATIIRLITSLEKAGCMSRRAHGEYTLGPSLLRYGSVYQSSFQLADRLLPILRGLVAESGETAAFFVRDGDMRVCLHRVESNSALSMHFREGARHPILPGGTGKVMLAFAGEPGEEYDRIREDFYVLNIGGREPEISSVAVPVLRADGALAGSMSLTGPTGKFTDGQSDRLVRLLLPAACEMTRWCGGDATLFGERIARL